jgi:hypothetical protein
MDHNVPVTKEPVVETAKKNQLRYFNINSDMTYDTSKKNNQNKIRNSYHQVTIEHTGFA